MLLEELGLVWPQIKQELRKLLVPAHKPGLGDEVRRLGWGAEGKVYWRLYLGGAHVEELG